MQAPSRSVESQRLTLVCFGASGLPGVLGEDLHGVGWPWGMAVGDGLGGCPEWWCCDAQIHHFVREVEMGFSMTALSVSV